MKKFLSLVLCFVMLFALSACGSSGVSQDDINALKDEISSLKDENESLREELDSVKDNLNAQLPDFADCEIGYELEVYPKIAFDYKVSEDCIVHIDSITATLAAKNVIGEDDLIEEAFYPFRITIIVSGVIKGTPPMRSETETNLVIDLITNELIAYSPRITIDSNNYETTYTIAMMKNAVIYFARIF